MSDIPSHALVAPSDIAAMAQVSRAAVSNWRKRAEDFPPPVAGTPAKPLFSRADVEAWLRATGREVNADWGLRTWSMLNALRGHIATTEMGNVVLSVACARKLSDEAPTAVPPWQHLLSQAAEKGFEPLNDLDAEEFGLPAWHELVHVSRGMFEAPDSAAHAVMVAFTEVPTEELAGAVDFALERIAGAHGRVGLEFGFVGSRVTKLLANVAAAEGSHVLYDPACGIGGTLLHAYAKLEEQGLPTGRVIGHDVNRDALLQAQQRAYLAGIPLEVAASDVLREDPDPGLQADVIVCEPPFGLRWEGNIADPRWRFGTPPARSADMAWLQHCIAHLDRGGRAFVVTPTGALFRGGPEAEIRAAMLRAGCVEAVYNLPGRMLPSTSIPLALWVLCPPGDNAFPDVVRIIDAREADALERDVHAWLTARPDELDPDRIRDIPVSELLAMQANLSADVWFRSELRLEDTATAYQSAVTALNTELDELVEFPRPMPVLDAPPVVRVVRVGELIEQGLVEYRAGRARKETIDDRSRLRLVTPADVRDGELPEVAELVDERDVLAEGTDLTQPGDVLVTTMHEIHTLVDEQGWHLPGNGIYRLRVVSDQLTPEYLAAVLKGEWNAHFQTGMTIKQAKVRDLEVPLLPRDVQETFLNTLRLVRQLWTQAASVAAEAAAVEAGLLNLIRYAGQDHS